MPARKKTTFAALFAALLLGSPHAVAQTLTCPTLTRIGVSALGYSSFEEDGKLRGASVGLADELAKRSGCKVEVKMFPRNRLFAELKTGNIDMAMAAIQTPERDQSGVFLPYGYAVFDLILSRDITEKYTSLEDFVKRGSGRLNLPRGSAYPPDIERLLAELDKAGRLERVADYGVTFTKIAVGRAAGTVCTPVYYQWHFQRNNVAPHLQVIRLNSAQRQPLGMYLSTSTLSAEQRSGYTHIVQQMIRDGVPAAMYAHFLDASAMARMFGPTAAH